MQGQFQRLKDNGYEYLYLDRGETTPILFILHGYGANAMDLAGLAHYLDPDGKWSWVFPEAPIRLSPMANAKGWFPIDEQAIQQAMMTGVPRNFQTQEVAGLEDKVNQLKSFIDGFSSQRKMIIGGFSQGGMMSLHIHRHFKDKLAGLLLMSCAIIDEDKFQAVSNPDFRTMMTHGKNDPVVSYNEGKYAKTKLEENQYQVELHDFEGGHEISLSALDKIKQYLIESCS